MDKITSTMKDIAAKLERLPYIRTWIALVASGLIAGFMLGGILPSLVSAKSTFAVVIGFLLGAVWLYGTILFWFHWYSSDEFKAFIHKITN